MSRPRLCVFCGSTLGARKVYADTARALGRLMVERGIELVYGGAHVGLMGILADTVLAAGGKVYGVIPRSMVAREIAHAGLTQLDVVETMHERKARMTDLADAFLALPGAYGTLDELCEILTWAQLGIHDKPIGLLNLDGYFDGLLGFLDHATNEQFLRRENRVLLKVQSDAAALLDTLGLRYNQ